MVEVRRAFFELLLDGVFPIECFACGEYGSWWCTACQDRVVLLSERRCLGCNQISAHGDTCYACLKRGYPLDGFLAATAYHEAQVEEAIGYFKYQCVRALDAPLASLLAQAFHHSRLTDTWWHAVPVPLHVRRERMRGFNQSARLADLLGENTGVEVLPLLERVRATHPQMELSAKERRRNMVDGVFGLSNLDLIRAKNILLIDDVATTGSTLVACARVLKDAGARSIWGLTVAHG